MRKLSKSLLAIFVSGIPFLSAAAQCPIRPNPGTVVQDALSLKSSSGILHAEFTMRNSVDQFGYTHYCYNYKTSKGDAEAPTMRLNPGDKLSLDISNRNTAEDSGMEHMSGPPSQTCGDGGKMTIASTNVHFHGFNVPPKCHSDDVINTLIQPNTAPFPYRIQIPKNQPPGLYWYHPHPHGFTEFQVNGGAPGAIVIEGMQKVRPEVAGLRERVFVLRQQFLVPWVPGPYQLSINHQVANSPVFPAPIIKMKPGEKQFWRVANATLQDFMPLQVQFDGKPQKMLLIALDGYPLSKPRYEDTILLPPASRAEFIVQAPPAGVKANFLTQAYSTGITGNPDVFQILGDIVLSKQADETILTMPTRDAHSASMTKLRFAGLAKQTPTTARKLYFSEKFGGTGGPIEFYITVDGQEQKVFDANEKPAIVTHVGAVEDWTLENRALEAHAFHIHQLHFLLLEVDGKPVKHQDLRDTIELPAWDGQSAFHSVKMRMDFRDPDIVGTFVFHCHILLHEDLGMMHKILVKP